MKRRNGILLALSIMFSLQFFFFGLGTQAATYRQAGLSGYEQTPLSFLNKYQMVLTDRDSIGRAVNSHIQLKNDQEPSVKRAPTLTFDPVGWHNYKFNYKTASGTIAQAWLMNRGHLVGYQFCGLNDEPRNLVPETAYFNQGNFDSMDSGNINAMLYYESNLDKWLAQHPNDYLDYQVTPLYKGNEKLPRQVRLAYVGYTSAGQKEKIKFNSTREENGAGDATVVYLDNSSANAVIDYATGTATNTVLPNTTVVKAATTEPVATTNVYRLYNQNTGEHFYTTSAGERDSLVKSGWTYERVGWVAPAKSNAPVYRVYNPNSEGGDHYYTMSLFEANSLVSQGWRWDNKGQPAFYSGGNVKTYVAYNPNAKSGSHNYTTDMSEQSNLLSVGWLYGAVAWYAMANAPSTNAPSTNAPSTPPEGAQLFTFAGVTLSKQKDATYTIEVVKASGTIGYAKASQTVLVTGGGSSDVYWFSQNKMPSSTNKNNLKSMTIQEAVSKNKKLSNTEG